MYFDGIVGLLISFFLWAAIILDVDGGYDIFQKEERMVYFFRWGFGFLGEKRRLIFKVPMKDIRCIKIMPEVQRDILTRTPTFYRIVFMETINYELIPLTRIEDDLSFQEIVDKAFEIGRFVDVPVFLMYPLY
ncbi:uncharacterized protein LOC113868349 [Abrus precatorius]|nr:uncharacterized protein LOC113856947 [Abrus precatorius]XP_027348788.1 uncharacterized protein LOC113860574 [Abrus precatorius]XP_027357132.1 uncharacterized protein LOC113866507 [Abrus precatorius]XP_027359622.1 uncharacterized protein LOC113868349 [Abrus precatorius]